MSKTDLERTGEQLVQMAEGMARQVGIVMQAWQRAFLRTALSQRDVMLWPPRPSYHGTRPALDLPQLPPMGNHLHVRIPETRAMRLRRRRQHVRRLYRHKRGGRW